MAHRHSSEVSRIFAGLLAAAIPAGALAETELSVSGKLSSSITLTSDYRFRGLSRTFRDPAMQAGVRFTMPNKFYVGAWSSVVDKAQFTNSRGFEVNLSAGYRSEIVKDWILDVGVIQYLFPTESGFSTLEAYAGAEWKIFRLKIFHTLSNKFFGVTNAMHSQYFDASVRYPFRSDLFLSAHYGIQRVHENAGDYSDYSIGVEKTWDKWSVSGSIVGTDVDALSVNAAGRGVQLGRRGLVLSASRQF